MPESRIVPAGRALRPVPLPAGALDDIRTRARRRRTGRAATVGSAGLTAFVLLATSLTAGGLLEQREDSLHIGPATPVTEAPVTSPPSPVATPQADGAKVEALLERALPREQRADAPAPQAAAPVAGRAARPAASADPESPEEIEPGRKRYDPDALRNDDAGLLQLPDCEQTGRGSFSGWCLNPNVDTIEGSVALTVCRARDAGPARLEWATSQQVRFEVRNKWGDVLWTYDPRVRPERSSQDVAAEACVGWELPWALVDEDGDRLPEGDYTLRAGTTAASLGRITVQSSFRVPAPGEPVQPAAACAPSIKRVPTPPTAC